MEQWLESSGSWGSGYSAVWPSWLSSPFRLSVLGAMILVALVALGCAAWKARERARYCHERASYHASKERDYRSIADMLAQYAKSCESEGKHPTRGFWGTLFGTQPPVVDGNKLAEARYFSLLARFNERYAAHHHALRESFDLVEKRPWLGMPAEKGVDESASLGDIEAEVRNNPANTRFLGLRALMWHRTQRYDRAVVDLESAIHTSRDAQPTWDLYAQLVWIYATCPDAKYRDGKKAVALALSAFDLTTNETEKRLTLEILAAAQAELGGFDEAVRIEEGALKVIRDPVTVSGMRQRRESYVNRRPLRTAADVYEALGVYHLW